MTPDLPVTPSDAAACFDLALLLLALLPWIWAAKPWQRLPPKQT